MKNHRAFLLLLVSLAVVGACCHRALAAPVAASAAFERTAVKAGLDRLGVGDGYQIVIADECDAVEHTAARMMQRLFENAAIPVSIVTESQSEAGKRIILGRESNLRAVKELGGAGEVSIRDVAAEDDGFHVKKSGNDIVIAGANPRGVLYGVYAFEEFVYTGAAGVLDIKSVPYFRKRGSGLHYTDVFFSAELPPFPEANAVCLSRLGINQLTDQGIGGHFTKFVKSDVFQFQPLPDSEFQQRVKDMSAMCKKYGVDTYLFIVEPALQTIDGSYDAYPEEALGTVRPPWGGDTAGLARTLCVSSPITQEYLRNMMRNLVRDYPDVKGIDLYNLDAGSWFCTPGLCERCKRVCTGSPEEAFNPAETQALLVKLLSDAAHEERAEFEVRFWSTVHYHGERFENLIRAVEGYDGLMSAWTGSDRSLMVPDAAKRAATCVLAQEVAKERNVPFYMMCEFNNLEAIPKSLPFPFHVADALAKYNGWDVTNLTEIFGFAAEHNSINALVTKEFEWNPDQNAEQFLTGLAHRQFGSAAGDVMMRAWKEMEKAFDVWNDVEGPPFPLNGSQFHVKIGTSIGGLPPAIVPNIVEYYDSTIDILTNVEPWLAAGYQEHKSEAFLGKLESMSSHLTQAAAYAKDAIDVASDQEFIGISPYEGENGRPTCRQYAELNYAPIAIGDSLCRQRCNILRAFRVLTERDAARAAGDEKTAEEKERLYRELVQEDIGVQERFCELLTGFATMQPHYTRTSLTEQEIANCLSVTQAKIAELKLVLAP